VADSNGNSAKEPRLSDAENLLMEPDDHGFDRVGFELTDSGEWIVKDPIAQAQWEELISASRDDRQRLRQSSVRNKRIAPAA
jgi:hypothetical protein